MGNVVEFRPAAAGQPDNTRAPTSASADIVIFPGIRYERHVEPREPTPAPSRGGRTRSHRRNGK
jgi:hypothetical protein